MIASNINALLETGDFVAAYEPQGILMQKKGCFDRTFSEQTITNSRLTRNSIRSDFANVTSANEYRSTKCN